MNAIVEYIKDVLGGVKSLLTGMSVTVKYFFSPGAIVTQQYPENRDTLKMFDRFKGNVYMIHNEQNQHTCTGCGICEMNCPNGSIEVISKTIVVDDKKKKALDKHIYRMGMCTFCGLCVKTCPSKSLAFGQEFENSVYNRSDLNRILNKPNSTIAN